MTAQTESRLPSALYCDLFYANPGADEFRREHVRVWVLGELAGDVSYTAAALRQRLLAAYPGIQVSVDEFELLLRAMDQSEEITVDNGAITLTDESRRTVAAARRRYTASRSAFLGSVIAFVDNEIESKLSAAERTSLETCVENLVIQVMVAERDALESLYGNRSDFSHVASEARKHGAQLEECIGMKAPETLATRRRELRMESVSGIGRAADAAQSYLTTVNRSIVSAFFLIRDPHHVEEIRRQATDRTYFLDTNVYLAWLYSSQPAHGIVSTLLNALQRHGARLRVLPETAEEIRRIEDEVKNVVPRALGDPQLAKYLAANRKAIFADFWQSFELDRNLRFSTFADLYMGVERLLQQHGIEIEPVEFEAGEDFAEQVPTFRNAIRGSKESKNRVVSDLALEHDAVALVKIAKLQLRGQRDEWGSSYQFLTLDGALAAAVGEVRNVLNRRIDRPSHPAQLARLFVPAAGPSIGEDEYGQFVVASVRDHLGLLGEISGYSSVRLMDKLDQAGIPVRTLLTAPPNLLESALAQLQGRRDLNRRLDQVLSTSPEDRKPLLTEIQRDLEEAITVGSDLLRETEAKVGAHAAANRELEQRVESMDTSLREMQLKLHEQTRSVEVEKARADRMNSEMRRWAMAAIGLAVLVAVLLIIVIVSQF